MRDLRLLILSWLVAVTVTACGPHIETWYSYNQPSSSEGKRCVQQCKTTRSQCERESRILVENCKTRRLVRAEADYHAYLRSLRRGEKPTRSISDFESGSCYSETPRCQAEYHDCYASCGGQVITKQICTARCDELKPPVAPGTLVGPILVNGVPEHTSSERPAVSRPSKAALGSSLVTGGLAQTYDVRGTNDDEGYEGTVTVRQDGDRYRIRWNIGSEIYHGVGTLNGDRLIIEGRHEGKPFRCDLRVAPDGTLSGRWTGDEGAGKEEWSPS